MLTFGEVANFGDVEMTDEGDDAELLVPPPPIAPLLSCLKLLMVLFRQTFRSLFDDGSLFSLLSDDDGDMKNGFERHEEVVGVWRTANDELNMLFGLFGAFVKYVCVPVVAYF